MVAFQDMEVVVLEYILGVAVMDNRQIEVVQKCNC